MAAWHHAEMEGRLHIPVLYTFLRDPRRQHLEGLEKARRDEAKLDAGEVSSEAC